MRKTAHVSMLVEFDDEFTPAKVVADFHNGVLSLLGDARIISTPEVTVHTRPITSLALSEYMYVISAMEARGGAFVRALGEALLRADSTNSEKLCTEFWNTICTYRPVEVPA